MAVTATSSATTLTGTGTSGGGLASISGSDFMNLLIKQLQYQDPLEPMSNQEMMQQMATIWQLETNTQLADQLEMVTDQQRFGSAAVLIGKYVQGTVSDDSGNEYTIDGVVKSVLFTPQGEVVLELENGYTLPLANLEQVMDAASTGGSDALTTAKSLAQTTTARTVSPATAAKSAARMLARAVGL